MVDGGFGGGGSLWEEGISAAFWHGAFDQRGTAVIAWYVRRGRCLVGGRNGVGWMIPLAHANMLHVCSHAVSEFDLACRQAARVAWSRLWRAREDV